MEDPGTVYRPGLDVVPKDGWSVTLEGPFVQNSWT